MDEAILHLLKDRSGQFVSGEEISRQVGVTRSAIWKGIEKLREEGYQISGQSHQGYKLVTSPDRLTAQELTWNFKPKRIGSQIHAYETTQSTMGIARQLASGSAPDGTVVMAEAQSKGRGRLGRVWTSPKAKGIYTSILLKPQMALKEVPLVTLMVAVGVARAIEQQTGLKPEIKWPNDLLLGGRKVAGILTELDAELDRIHFVIVGIGMNVNSAQSSLPEGATALSLELGHKVDRVQMARGLLEALDQVYDVCLNEGFASILEAWRGYAHFLSGQVRVSIQGREVVGQAMDIDDSGALLVRQPTGRVETVAAGDVLLMRGDK